MQYRLYSNVIEKILNGKELIETLQKKIINVDFCHEKKLLIVNGKKIKVVDDYEWAFKLQKTQIRVKNGSKGLEKDLIDANNDDSPFNSYYFKSLLNCIYKVKEAK